MRIALHAVFSLLLLASCANAVVEEQVDAVDGDVIACGEGEGLSPCLDANGETMSEAENPDYIEMDSTQQLEESSKAIRAETPKELEHTIQDMEESD